ncbi:MAG: MFS transporter [Fimbriiglobus sp.]
MSGDPLPEKTTEIRTPEEKAARRAMLIVFLVVFIDLLGFGIVLPLMPRYANRFLGDIDEVWRGPIIGALYSSFSVMQFVFSPMWGRVSDRIGRRPILMLGLAGSVVFYALFGFASALPAESAYLAIGLLLLSRIGAGIAGASVGTAAAVIADCTPPERRAKGMALIGAAFGIGFTFGPLIAYASLLLHSEPWAPGAVASLLSALALVLAICVLPETLKPGPRHGREFFSLTRTTQVLRMPAVGMLVLMYFLAIFAFANFEGTLALFTQDAFGMNEEQNFLVFAFIGFVLMVVQGGIYRPLAGRRSEEYLMKIGLFCMLAGLFGVGANAAGSFMLRNTGGEPSQSMSVFFYFSVAVAVAGFAFVNPSVSALISKNADPTRQGEVIGVNQSFAALGRILGPFLGSVLFYQHASRVLPYLLATMLLLIVGGLLVSQRSTTPAPAPTT